MKWSFFIVIQCLIVLIVSGIVYFHQDRVIVLKEPPESIAQWYKPQNKRQVWLHTMFKLRREMLAVEIYAKTQDDHNLEKWSEKLTKDYHKIAEMVPEWQKKLDMLAITDMQQSVGEKRYSDVVRALVDLDENCTSCHLDYRVVTATMYRAPDFSDMKIDDSTTLVLHMQKMSKQLNRIKIAFVDGQMDVAQSALKDLGKSMDSLGRTCESCHKNSPKTFPDENIIQSLADLQQHLKTGTLKEQGKALGTLAVKVCAECHGVHRLSSDVKSLLQKDKSWVELIKHSF